MACVMVSFQNLPFTAFLSWLPCQELHTYMTSLSLWSLPGVGGGFLPKGQQNTQQLSSYSVVNLTGPGNVGGETGKSCHNIQEAATVLPPYVDESWRFLRKAGQGMCDAPQRGVEVFAVLKHFSCSGVRQVVRGLKCAVAPCKPACPSDPCATP